MYNQLSAQFTEDIAATQAYICERKNCASGRIIQVGEKRLYVSSEDPTMPGKYVCEGCYLVYQTRSSSTTKRLEIMPDSKGVSSLHRTINVSITNKLNRDH